MSNVSEREREEGPVENFSMGLDHEQEVQRLRRSCSAAKGNVTKKIKELNEWKMSCESLGDARLKFKEFEDTVKNFYQAYTKYHDAINDEYDITDSQEYLATEQMRIDNFSRTLEEWMRSVENQPINQAQINGVWLTDSASNVELSSRKDSRLSKVSRSSSSLSARLAIRAKRAALYISGEV